MVPSVARRLPRTVGLRVHRHIQYRLHPGLIRSPHGVDPPAPVSLRQRVRGVRHRFRDRTAPRPRPSGPNDLTPASYEVWYPSRVSNLIRTARLTSTAGL